MYLGKTYVHFYQKMKNMNKKTRAFCINYDHFTKKTRVFCINYDRFTKKRGGGRKRIRRIPELTAQIIRP